MKKNLTKTGGGKLKGKDLRIVESPMYRDAAIKMGISATGNDARMDSDSQTMVGTVPPTKRLKNLTPSNNLLTNLSDESLEFEIDLMSRENDDVGPTTFENILSQQTPNTSKKTSASMTSSSRAVSSRSTATNIRNMKSVSSDHSTQMTENLNQQSTNNSLQKEYLELQVERTKIAIEREKLQKRLVEIEVMKAELLMEDEIQHRQEMMKLEAERMRREM